MAQHNVVEGGVVCDYVNPTSGERCEKRACCNVHLGAHKRIHGIAGTTRNASGVKRPSAAKALKSEGRNVLEKMTWEMRRLWAVEAEQRSVIDGQWDKIKDLEKGGKILLQRVAKKDEEIMGLRRQIAELKQDLKRPKDPLAEVFSSDEIERLMGARKR